MKISPRYITEINCLNYFTREADKKIPFKAILNCRTLIHQLRNGGASHFEKQQRERESLFYSEGLSQFLVPVCEYVYIYLTVYDETRSWSKHFVENLSTVKKKIDCPTSQAVSAFKRKRKRFVAPKEQNMAFCGMNDP